MQVADDLGVELVGLLLEVVDLHDEVHEVLRLLEVAEVAHGVVERLAAALDELCEFKGLVMHEVDVIHVEAEHDVFDVVDDVVERLAHLDDVLAVDGGDEVGGDRLEDLVVDRVALVLDLMRLLRVLLERGRFRELLDGLNQQRRLGDGKLRVLLECAEIVELVLPAHGVSF